MRILLPDENFREKPLNSPKQTVERYFTKQGIEYGKPKIPKRIVLSLSVGVTQRLLDLTNAKRIDWMYKARPLYAGAYNGTSVGIIWASTGAPLAAMVMEDLIAAGAKIFLGIGLFAAIQPKISIGDISIPISAIRDEGTSYHYLPKSKLAKGNNRILRILCKNSSARGVVPHIGQIWTTDAVYRETPSKLQYFSRLGVLGVDMETSAIYSVGLYRRVIAACILVCSANIQAKKRDIGFYQEKLDGSIGTAINVGLESIIKMKLQRLGSG